MDFCPTDDMWGDYFTKPLQGAKFLKICQVIMNEPGGRSVLESEQILPKEEQAEKEGKKQPEILLTDESVLTG